MTTPPRSAAQPAYQTVEQTAIEAPRLVAFDIDGTLLSSSKTPQPGTLRALDGLRAAGTRIMLASGRPIPGLRALAERHGLGEDLILAGLNGSVIVDQATGATLARRPVPTELAGDLIATGIRHGVLLMLPHDDELIVADDGHPQAAHEAGGNGLTLRVVDDITSPGIEPTKILYCAERPVLESLEAELRSDYGEQIELTYSSPIYMEATAAGVDKSTAILDWCRAEGIDAAATVAFGDNGNDVTMLRAAGLGVAMGNAIPEAQEAADVVTSSNDDEGIARVLSRWVDVGELEPATSFRHGSVC
ncbi:MULTISPECIES: HAD family hydrolase [Actinomycetes]|uniref:Cof-type HAD-IIB family hydrolase n=2 Tax=Actinomycetes TaxID=1760 RepID=A0ABP6LRX6_9MICC